MTCLLEPLHGCCSGPLLVMKVSLVADGVWFPNGALGSTNDSFAGVEDVWVLVLAVCDGASDGDSVANADNTGGAMVSNRGIDATFVVIPAVPVNNTVLGTVSFPVCA